MSSDRNFFLSFYFLSLAIIIDFSYRLDLYNDCVSCDILDFDLMIIV